MHGLVIERKRGEMIDRISTGELKSGLDRGEPVILVETLRPASYRQAHLPGAINIPPGKVQELAPSLLPEKSAHIVVYCAGPS